SHTRGWKTGSIHGPSGGRSARKAMPRRTWARPTRTMSGRAGPVAGRWRSVQCAPAGAGTHPLGAEDWRVAAPGVSWVRDPRQWQFHDEGRPVAFLARDLDASPMRLDEILRLVETDAPSAA